LESGKKIGVERVHQEEDTGKLQHTVLNGEKVTLVDFNRSGVPLVEIVSKPDMSGSQEAKEYLKRIFEIVRTLGVSKADMEKGQMRLEPTVNVRIENESGIHFTPLVEIKNINSFNFAVAAIEFEIKRQVEEFGSTGIEKTPTNKTTRGYDSVKKVTFLQRTKEEAKDYRYFPEPDIPPYVIEDDVIEKLRLEIPILPDQEVSSLVEMGVDRKDAKILVSSENRVAIQIIKDYSSDPDVDVKKLASLIVNGKLDPAKDTKSQYQSLTKVGITDKSILVEVIQKIIDANPSIVAEYKKGKTNVAGFFVGQAMKETKGTADPKTLNEVVLEILNQ
jgi:aspartyl-tRNA(Asn)/glutamyl-tRNA(Gln) amidotransferase subunit B